MRSSPDEPTRPKPLDPAAPPATPPLPGNKTLAELAFGTEADAASGGESIWSRTFDNVEINLDDPAQRKFGDYELLERIGEGGMGLVYRARQATLDREVALKLLAAGPWASNDFIERFTREAQHAARMEHPNIVTVYDVGTVEQLHFFSMRLVRGETLARRLHRHGPFDPREAARLMRTVAEAVAYAHSLDVLHLDLKPGNILLDSSGAPHVADFGLARRLNRMLAVENIEVAGTPSYMAPEQTRAHQGHLSAATDIWSLGAICHELVTGRPPFRGDSAQDTLNLVREGRVRRPSRSRPQVPRDLEAIILKCLAKQPDGRYQSARALADDLGRFLDHRQVRARPLNPLQRLPRWARREPKLAVTMALALLALLVSLVATTQQWRRADANAQRAALNAATARELLWDMRDQAALRFGESGEGWLAAPVLLANLREQQAHGEPQRGQAVRERLGILENSNPQLIDIAAQPAASVLAFSPDGHRLAVGTHTRQLRLIDVLSGAQRWQTSIPRGLVQDDSGSVSSLRFSPDGLRLIAGVAATQTAIQPAHEQMLLFSASDGRRIEPPAAFGHLADASYSPDGRFALLTDRAGAVQMWGTQPWRAVGAKGRLQPALPAGIGPRLVAVDGSFFVAMLARGSLVLFDARTLAARLTPELGAFGQTTSWALSPDGQWLAVGDAIGRVRMIDCAKGAVRVLSPQSPQGVRWLAFSSDGTWLAAAAGPAGVFLWDWSQGRLLASPFGGDPPADHVDVDRAHARVLTSSDTASGAGTATVWEVAAARFDLDRTAAVQLGERFSVSSSGGSAALAWDPATDLLASVRSSEDRSPLAGTALLRLERLRAPILKTVHGAPIKPGVLRFDGHRLVAVDATHVQLVNANSETALEPPIDLAQAPGFAELSPAGDFLVVSTGRAVHVYDASSGKPRLAAPILLRNSPQRVVIRPDGRAVLTTWLEHNAGGMSEVAELWNPATGARLAGPVDLPGPLDGLRYSADGRRLVAWDRRRLSVRDGASLAAVAGPSAALRADAFQSRGARAEWATAAVTPAGVLLAVIGETGPDGHEQDRLLSFDGRRAAQVSVLRPGSVEVLPLPDSDRLLIASANGAVDLLAPNGSRSPLPDYPGIVPARGIAVSADGRWIARALRDGVEIYTARGATRIARLRAPLPLPDQVWQLAFSADGTRLLGRSLGNRYLVWNLAPDTRPPDAIEHALALRGISGLQVPTTALADASERATLRATDAGPPKPADRPEPAAIRQLPGGGVPARDPQTPAEALDLSPWYNFALSEVDRASRHTAGDFGWLPQGTQRLLGTDYDLRGFIQLHDPAAPYSAQGPIPRQVRIGLPSPADIAALDVLLVEQFRTSGGKAAAAIEIAYRNGQRARLPILAGSQIHAYWRMDIGAQARLAAYGWDARALQARQEPVHVYAIRLPNPHPQWPIDALTLMALPGMGGAPAFLAVTMEPRGIPDSFDAAVTPPDPGVHRDDEP